MSLRARLVPIALAAVALVSIGASPAAAAGPTASGIFVACGYGTSTGGGDSCLSLPDALAQAAAFNYDATVILLPGDYCPVQIAASVHRLTIVGAGIGGVPTGGGPVSISGEEAALSEFLFDAAHCPTDPQNAPTALLSVVGHSGLLTLKNLAFAGGGSGPTTGVSSTTTPLTLRDVLVKDMPYQGIYYYGDNLSMGNSALIDNATGLYLAGTGSVDESTVAGNSSAGLYDGGALELGNDTISHNAVGVYLQSSSGADAANSIVAGNTTDCSGSTFDWEHDYYTHGSSGSGYNLLAANSTCHTAVATDLTLNDGTAIADVQDNGGPTPSILPPAEADGKATYGWCGTTGTDQREATMPAGDNSCDIGSVDQGSTGTTSGYASPQSLAFDSQPVGSTGYRSTGIANAGGGMVFVSGVDISGTGFSLAGESCTYAVLEREQSSSCYVNVSVTPEATGPLSGTLTVHTTDGDLVVPLTGDAVPPPDATALSSPASSTIGYGATLKLAPALTDTVTPGPVSGATVRLLSRAGTSGSFRQLTTATTDSSGVAHFSVAPKVNTQYECVYDGDAAHDPVTSGVGTVRVAQVVHATLSPHKIRHGSSAKVYGTVSPADNGQTVVLQRLTSGHWKNTALTATIHRQKLPNGTTTVGYVFTVPEKSRGTYALRVARAATATNAAGVSPKLTLTVT